MLKTGFSGSSLVTASFPHTVTLIFTTWLTVSRHVEPLTNTSLYIVYDLSILRTGLTRPETASLKVGFETRAMSASDDRVSPVSSVTKLT